MADLHTPSIPRLTCCDVLFVCPPPFCRNSLIERNLCVSKCGPDECARRQDGALPRPFERDTTKSQLWSEKCFIHCLRMIAVAIDGDYQAAVETMVKDCKGEFKSTAIKGYGRMHNKCVSKEDHYHDPYPR
jgi:hypothetical protein